MTALDEALLAFNRSTREMGLGGPVKIVQTDTDPGDMGEPRIVHDEYGNTIVFVPSYELWPRGAAVSDAAVDVFAEAFEDDPIQRAVAAAMAKLGRQVQGLEGRRATKITDDDGRWDDAVPRYQVLILISDHIGATPVHEATP